jgi:hypothetical protein
MTYFDEDPWADVEALGNLRHEADMEQAEMEAAGNAIARAERAGICTHGSAAGYHNPPLYPEQAGLKPGQLATRAAARPCSTPMRTGTPRWMRRFSHDRSACAPVRRPPRLVSPERGA